MSKGMAAAAMSSHYSEEAAEVVTATTTGRWRWSLASGLRAALACTIVGLVSLYAPPAVRRHITFPAFSYVVTVIIVTDATLGTALRGAVSAVHATLMGAAPSVAALWLAHRTAGAAESVLATSAVVALTAFAVALPESVGPVAKRIALGQTIIVYVAMFRRGEHPSRALALQHPANVVACTALGVAAALLAVLLPWPRLATREARDKGRAYKLLAAERVRVLCDAAFFMITSSTTSSMEMETETEVCCSRRQRQRRWQMAACMSEANRLASASTALLSRINAIKEDLQWEQRGVVLVDHDNRTKQQTSMEMAMTGMQIALAMMMKAHTDDDDDDQSGGSGGKEYGNMVGGLVMAMRDQIRLALLTSPNIITTKHQPLQHRRRLGRSSSISSMPMTTTALPQLRLLLLPPFLFLFSLHQLHQQLCCGGAPAPSAAVIGGNANTKVAPASSAEQQGEVVDHGGEDPPPQAEEAAATAAAKPKQQQQQQPCPPDRLLHWPPRRRLVAAAKCGLSLGLAVLLGLLFSNDHGFWSGLIVATTMNAGRESTWAVAVARAHGTALGSVYGALCCLLISRQQRLLAMDLRFLLAILPWMVLATFLKRSRAYGTAGGVAAALSVVIIVGRRYDESPMAFTMARLVETFIGIACAVLADIVFQPGARPSVQAREQLTRCIAGLADCLVVADGDADDELKLKIRLQQQQQQLALMMLRFRKHVVEAGSEPTYLWLPPFPAACYDKILGSLSRMAQMLELYHQAVLVMSCNSFSSQQADGTADDSEEDDDTMMQRAQARFSSLVSTSLRHCLRMLLQQEASKHQQEAVVVDLEAGTGGDAHAGSRCCCCCKVEEATTFRDQAAAALLEEHHHDDDDDVLSSLSCLGSIALCMSEVVKEAQRLEAHILDLLNSLQQPAPR